jgi:hypothetical protein
MEQQVKSKQRVADHGEVFTPAWMVEAMLDLVKDETERIDSRFLEPACGSGNSLIQNWMRNRNTIEFLGIWEQLNNPAFNSIEFDGIKNQAGLNSFSLTLFGKTAQQSRDEVLYEKYGLSNDEIAYIENCIRPRNTNNE